MNDDYEPVFKRSKWGTSRYVYNPNNPVGLALIIISLVFVAIMMIMMANRAGPFAPPQQPEPWSPPPEAEYQWPAPSADTSANSTPSSGEQTHRSPR